MADEDMDMGAEDVDVGARDDRKPNLAIVIVPRGNRLEVPIASPSSLETPTPLNNNSRPGSYFSTASTDVPPQSPNKMTFAYSASQLADMITANPPLEIFKKFEGLRGIEKGLHTNCEAGLSVDQTHANASAALSLAKSGNLKPLGVTPSRRMTRQDVFGINQLPEAKVKGFFELALDAITENTLLILFGCGLVESILGLMSANFWKCLSGAVIMVSIIFVVLVATYPEWLKEKEFSNLEKRKDDRNVRAIRTGEKVIIPVHGILVGDVLCLEAGDIVPADGILISCDSYCNITCDESSFTGESQAASKICGDEAYRRLGDGYDHVPGAAKPFILSGSKVLNGTGTYLVTGVGINSCDGKVKSRVKRSREKTPLERSLQLLTEKVSWAAVVLAVILFFAFVVMATIRRSNEGDSLLAIILEGFTRAIALLVVIVPEGLPVAVTLGLVYSTLMMHKKDQLLVRRPAACETMGNVTTICTDKTGTLTMNEMHVAAGIIGDTSFMDMITSSGPGLAGYYSRLGSSHVPSRMFSELSPGMKALLVDSVCLNSTAFKDSRKGKNKFVGCQTESALLRFAERLDNASLQGMDGGNRGNRGNRVTRFPFDSRNKYMATVIQLPNGPYRLYAKGAPEILLWRCSSIVMGPTERIEESELTLERHRCVSEAVDKYAIDALRTLALAYRDFPTWPPAGLPQSSDSCDEQLNMLCRDLTLVGVFGIHDPLRPGVEKAVTLCQLAGVTVRMVTGDNIKTARAVAKASGILMPDGVVMEGSMFKALPEAERDQILPRLQVLARSTPEDKELLVRMLKARGETVAVTGDGTNDGPALCAADVGLSMGSGTEVAKAASSIVLMDDDFSSIVKAIARGRTVGDAIKKFIRFQLAVTTSSTGITVLNLMLSKYFLPGINITTAQWLWINLIMDPLAALGLATDEPDPSVLKRRPESSTASSTAALISPAALKMIIGQAVCQFTTVICLSYVWMGALGKGETMSEEERGLLQTVTFNTYVWLLFFNLLNNRRLDNFNIFAGIHRNGWLLGVMAFITVIQVIIVQFGGSVLSVTRLTAVQWGMCLALGCISMPVGVLIRLTSAQRPRRYDRDNVIEEVTPYASALGARSWMPILSWCRAVVFLETRSPRGDVESGTTDERASLLGEEYLDEL